MFKELIISIFIVIFIVIGNILTQNYVKNSVGQMDSDLNKLRGEIIQGTTNKQELDKTINEVHDKWDKMYSKLSYFIEHDELEKVETDLSSLRGNIEMEEYGQAVPELDKCIYILNHIKDKNSLMIQNIF